MFISIALLGFGHVGKEVYKRLREIPGYMEDFRIHVIQVPNLDNYPVANDKDWYNWLDDDTFGTDKQVSIGDDVEWLVNSEGHDTIVDCMSYNENSKNLIFNLATKRHWILTCSKELVNKHARELISVAKENGSRISFNSIPASATPCEYDDIDLNQDTFLQHSDGPLYVYRGAGPEITAEYLVKEIAVELKKRRNQKVVWDAMSPDEQSRIIAADTAK
jgi:hypothetical protein